MPAAYLYAPPFHCLPDFVETTGSCCERLLVGGSSAPPTERSTPAVPCIQVHYSTSITEEGWKKKSRVPTLDQYHQHIYHKEARCSVVQMHSFTQEHWTAYHIRPMILLFFFPLSCVRNLRSCRVCGTCSIHVRTTSWTITPHVNVGAKKRKISFPLQLHDEPFFGQWSVPTHLLC